MEIRKLRESKGITRAKLASTIGVSITALQNWENGTSKPNPQNKRKLEKALK